MECDTAVYVSDLIWGLYVDLFILFLVCIKIYIILGVLRRSFRRYSLSPSLVCPPFSSVIVDFQY